VHPRAPRSTASRIHHANPGQTPERSPLRPMVTAEASGTPGSATWTPGSVTLPPGSCRPEVTAPIATTSLHVAKMSIGSASAGRLEPQRSHDDYLYRKGQRARLRWVLARRMPLVAEGIHVADHLWRARVHRTIGRHLHCAKCGGDRQYRRRSGRRWSRCSLSRSFR